MGTHSTTTTGVEINMFAKRTAEMIVERKEEFDSPKGKQIVEIAEKIVSGTVSEKEMNKFRSERDFISMSFM